MKSILVGIAAFFVLHGLQAQNTPWPLTGNVGIGTTTPGANLVVNGKARIISNLAIGVDGDGPSFFPLYLNGSNGASIGFNLSAQSADQKVWSLIANGNSFRIITENDAYNAIQEALNITRTGYAVSMTTFPNGNVGIGITNPTSKLHLQGSSLGSNLGDKDKWLTVTGGCGTGGNNSILDIYNYRNTAAGNSWLTASTRIQQTIDATPMGYIEFNPLNMRFGMALGTNNQDQLYIDGNGQVGIGTASINDATYKLFVETGIRTRKVKVDAVAWPDYVFHKSYPLPSLPRVEKFVRENQHLPGVPSATQVQKDGLDLGDNQSLLLKKIEELTLYLIQQNKELSSQRKRIHRLEQLLEQKHTN